MGSAVPARPVLTAASRWAGTGSLPPLPSPPPQGCAAPGLVHTVLEIVGGFHGPPRQAILHPSKLQTDRVCWYLKASAAQHLNANQSHKQLSIYLPLITCLHTSSTSLTGGRGRGPELPSGLGGTGENAGTPRGAPAPPPRVASEGRLAFLRGARDKRQRGGLSAATGQVF